MEAEIENDQELYSYFRGRNAMLCKENFMFLMNHPEVKRLLNDYLSNILLHKPDDVFKHTKDYFKILSDKGQSELFVILVGPSSVGKTSLISHILKTFEDKDIFVQPKYTSTKKKDNCYTMSKEAFIGLMNKKEIITYSYDNKEKEYEGLTREEIDRIKKSGKICIMEIDLNGAKKINNSCVGGNFIGILPPSLDALRERIKEHVKANTAGINKMLDKAKDEIKEIETYSFFTYRIMNDNIDTGLKDFTNCIYSLYPFLKYGNEKIEISAQSDQIIVKESEDEEDKDQEKSENEIEKKDTRKEEEKSIN